MITGIDHPTDGRMVIGGTDIYSGVTESQRSRWRGRNLGIVFQFFQLLPMLTLLENVMLSMDFAEMYDFDERPERAMEMLKLVGLEKFANKLPVLVSTGQQQLAAIARALACDPPLLVADEPTGNLDSKSANAIIDLFDELSHRDKTVVMVTHDPSLTSRTTRNIVIADGVIVGDSKKDRWLRKCPAPLVETNSVERNRMKPRWRKVIHDLLDNKARTLLVVLSIAVGVFSIGVIAGAYQIISHDMSASYSANKPANIELRMTNFDDDVLTMIRNQRGVEDAEGRRVFNMRVRVPGSGKWTALDMIAFDDFEKNSIDLLTLVEGQNIPKKRQVLLEQDALQHINTGVGGLLEFQLPDGSTKTLPVVGVVQDTAAGAGDFLASPPATSPWTLWNTWDNPDFSTAPW